MVTYIQIHNSSAHPIFVLLFQMFVEHQIVFALFASFKAPFLNSIFELHTSVPYFMGIFPVYLWSLLFIHIYIIFVLKTAVCSSDN